MRKRLTALILALTFCAAPAVCLADDEQLWRDPTVSMKNWEIVGVLDATLDEANQGDTFLSRAAGYELARIGVDKLDDLTYLQGEQDPILPDAYITAELLRYEKKRYWINASSEAVEQRYTRTETYRDGDGNERERYITHIETDIQDYRPGYGYRSYVRAKVSVLDPVSRRPIMTYSASEDGDKSTIDLYRDIVKDFYKKLKKEMKK